MSNYTAGFGLIVFTKSTLTLPSPPWPHVQPYRLFYTHTHTRPPSFLSIYPSIYLPLSPHNIYTTLIGPIANNNPTKSNYTCIINMFIHTWYPYYSCTHPDVFLTRFGVNVVIKIKVTYTIDIILYGQAGLPMHTIREGAINYYFQNGTGL